MISRYLMPAAAVSLIANVALFMMWTNAREAVVEERGACNSDKLLVELESTRQELAQQSIAHENERKSWASIVEKERRAAAIASEEARLAASRPAKVKRVIERIADENACMGLPVPDSAVDSVFDG